MGSYRNWLAAKGRVDRVRAVDSAKIIKRIQKQGQERLKRLTAAIADPDFIANPRKFHEKKLAAAKADPQVATIYKKIREALWNWPEFASLSPGARAILETVIELAREEAFPWFVMVPGREVRKLARLSHPAFVKCAQEIELLAISREAKVFSIRDENDGPDWDSYMNQSLFTTPPETNSENSIENDISNANQKAPTYLTYNDVDLSVNNGKCKNLRNISRAGGEESGTKVCDVETLENYNHSDTPTLRHPHTSPLPQWVVRYRRGGPWHPKRAAWWINYDLLCGTSRVLECFVAGMDNLPVPYVNRARANRANQVNMSDSEKEIKVERRWTVRGPAPTPGLRAALWREYGSQAFSLP